MVYNLSDHFLAMIVRSHAALRSGLGHKGALIGNRVVDHPKEFAAWLKWGTPWTPDTPKKDLPDWAKPPSNQPIHLHDVSTDLVEFEQADWSEFKAILKQLVAAVQKGKTDPLTYMVSPGMTGDNQELITVRICSLYAPGKKATAKALLPKLALALQALLPGVRVSVRLGVSASLQNGMARPGMCVSNSEGTQFTQTAVVRAIDDSPLGKAKGNRVDMRYVIVPGHGLFNTGRREFHNSVYQPPGEIDARSLVGRIPEAEIERHVRFDYRISRLKNLDGAAVPLSTHSPPTSIIPPGADAPIMATEPPSEHWMGAEVLVFTGKNGVRTANIVAVRDEIQMTDDSGATHDYTDICVLQDTGVSKQSGRPRRITRRGDSGSPVCIQQGTSLRLIGYIVGGSRKNGSEGRVAESYFLPVEPLFEALAVEVAT